MRDEIAVFLTPELQRNDLWEQSESGLEKLFKEYPEIFSKLLDTPEDELNGADYWFKASYLELKRDFSKSSEMFKNAFSKIYTKDYIDGWASQMDYIINSIDDSSKTIVDIASGKGYLVEKLLAETDNQIIATDFSPTILKRNKEYYKFKGLYDRLSLIAFDARKTPFKNNSIEILTSNLGLPNIEHPGSVVSELNRVLKEKFMSIMMFFDESDIVHLDLLKQYGLFAYATRNKALETFRKSAWRISLENQ